MNWKSAFGAGVVGGFVMTAIMALARLTAMTTMNLEMMLGSMITGTLGPGVWILGLGIHLVAAGVFGLIYGACFEYLSRRADWRIGIGYGIVHAFLSGLLMGIFPAMHPLMMTGDLPAPPGYLMPPGFFAVNFGLIGVFSFIALHLLFGALVGGAYRLRRRRRIRRREQFPQDEEMREAA